MDAEDSVLVEALFQDERDILSVLRQIYENQQLIAERFRHKKINNGNLYFLICVCFCLAMNFRRNETCMN